MDWRALFPRDADRNDTTSNFTANNSFQDSQNSFERPWERYARGPISPNIPMVAFLVMCICVSTFGNGAVLCIAVLKFKNNCIARLNLLITSLALSDLLQTLTMYPQLMKNLLGEWHCSILICKLHASLRSMQANISISTLTLLTLERFLYLDKVTDGSENKTFYICIIVFVWCIHMALAVPLGMWTTVMWSPRKCTIPVDTIPSTEVYVPLVKTAFFFLPLILMWICNMGIIYKIRKSSLSVQPLQVNRPVQDVSVKKRMKKEKRTILMCLVLAIVFTVTHLPFEICLFVLNSATSQQQVYKVVNVMAYLWPQTMLNSCINPFIYSVFFKEFRSKVKEMMRWSKCSGSNTGCCLKKSQSKNSTSFTTSRTDPPSLNTLTTLELGMRGYSKQGAGLSPMRVISLSGCRISGLTPSALRDHAPADGQGPMRVASLCGCHISGSTPSALRDHAPADGQGPMRVASLCGCHISGSTPSALRDHAPADGQGPMRVASLCGCHISGSTPSTLRDHAQAEGQGPMRVASLCGCHISGSTPSTLRDHAQAEGQGPMRVISLSGCHISGSTPSTLRDNAPIHNDNQLYQTQSGSC